MLSVSVAVLEGENSFWPAASGEKQKQDLTIELTQL